MHALPWSRPPEISMPAIIDVICNSSNFLPWKRDSSTDWRVLWGNVIGSASQGCWKEFWDPQRALFFHPGERTAKLHCGKTKVWPQEEESPPFNWCAGLDTVNKRSAFSKKRCYAMILSVWLIGCRFFMCSISEVQYVINTQPPSHPANPGPHSWHSTCM